ncbi:hypothetical protein [Maribellus sediminis]|uniref:hypothetical protein n=1 Tax=Maribellus sediminis TaxID=2696285 RepID=UPI001F0EB9DB|nr:hypothetical protein [Maribellus sediminis]
MKEKMGHEGIKLELIEWLTKLEDEETIAYLKIVKDSSENGTDWWDEISAEEKQSIQRGLKDIEEGRIFQDKEIRQKYGL